jgi:hypothetical protein
MVSGILKRSCGAVVALVFLWGVHAALAEVRPVTVSPTGMTRGGQPYFIRGVGGTDLMSEAAARGANSVRMWGPDGMADTLREADGLGLTVMAGIWLEPECSWFSYSRPADCEKQALRVREILTTHRTAPALLCWGLGNEVEGDGQNTAFWQQLEKLAQLAHEVDPAHPNFTAVAGLSEVKAQAIMAQCPSLDFVGINTYAALGGLRAHLEKWHWTRPWVVTEFGTRGFWECPKTAWGAPIEETPEQKSARFRKGYAAAIAPGGACLGSYAFVWGSKHEATSTWFGLLTEHGDTTPAVDVLQQLWTGKAPANAAPQLALKSTFTSPIAPGAAFTATTEASDPEGDPLTFTWQIRAERGPGRTSRNQEIPPSPEPSVIDLSHGPAAGTAHFYAPTKPGPYRLYVWVRDGHGHASGTNAPFLVK